MKFIPGIYEEFIYSQTKQNKLKTEQHEPLQRPGMNTGARAVKIPDQNTS